MIDERTKFDEQYDSDAYKTTTLYFTAPKELLNNKYPDAESAEISVEFPIGNFEPKYASVLISPTKNGSDYDWCDIDLPYEDIERLWTLYKMATIVNNFYFTFGSHSFFPYQNGYVIVKADTLSKAIEKFRSRFPDRHLNTVNCSFWYTEEEWRSTAMSSDKRYKCYEVIE